MESDSRDHRWKSAFSYAARWLIRSLAIGCSALIIWIASGSVVYTEWWYACLFRGGWRNNSFLRYGWSFLAINETWILICVSSICAIAFAVAVLYPLLRGRFLGFIDRWAMIILTTCVFVSILDVLFLYKTSDIDGVQGWVNEFKLAGYETAQNKLNEIVPPIDFLYLNSESVTELYSEIEPDLIEQRRTVSSEKKLSGSAGVDAGGARLGIEGARNGQETSEYQRNASTAARKCLELINFTLKNNSAHYYTTVDQFSNQVPWLAEYLKGPSRDPVINKIETDTFEATIKNLLKNTNGFVVVDGVYRVTRTGKSLSFEEEFSPEPRRVIFRFILLNPANAALFRDGRRMRVFGEITQLLDPQGVIEIHPLAIF